jgi:DNA-binding CsgD family transcriptional regulator
VRLTPRELEVLKALAAGETTKQTALRLGVDHKTVRSHRTNLYRKLGVANAPQAAVLAYRLLRG